MTDAPPTPASPANSDSLHARLAGAVIAILAAFTLYSAAPSDLAHLPGVGAVFSALGPDTAAADSYYTAEGCDNGTPTWTLSNAEGEASFIKGCTPSSGMSEISVGVLGVSGAHAFYEFYAPSGLTLSRFSAADVYSSASAGFGAGLMGDIGSGLLAENDPRNLAKGQATPDTTAGQSADCWGYGDAHTQVVTVDRAPSNGSCTASLTSPSYNLTGHNFVAIGIGSESRDCSDTADSGNCGTGNSGAYTDNPAVQIDDPANAPTLSGITVNGLPSGYNPSQWVSYQSDSGTISSSVLAQDYGGVCNVPVTISGPSGTVSSGGNPLGTVPAGYDQSTGDFAPGSGSTPAGCPTVAGGGTSGLSLQGLASGTYTVTAQAQNPGNVVGSGATSATSTTFNVDNQVPTVTIDGGTGQWSSDSSETYGVNASEAQNLSGIASLTCTGAGLPAGGQTFSGSSAQITETAQGDDAISCYATTNAGVSGADGSNVNSKTGTEGRSTDILIDTSSPSVAVDNDSPASRANGLIGDWVDPASSGTPETVDVYAAAGVSGIAATTSGTPASFAQWSTSGSSITSGPASNAALDNIQAGENVSSATMGGDTYGMPYCTVTDLSDPTTPGGSNYVSYNAAAGGNVGDGSNPAATPSVDADNKYVEWQIPFTQNGHYQLNCTVTNGAGVTVTLATETIEVDQTDSTALANAAGSATAAAGVATDATGGNPASSYVSPNSQSAAQWSGDPLRLTYAPAAASSDWPTNADPTDPTEVDPIVKTVCNPGGDASGESTSTTVASTASGPAPVQTDPNSLTVGDTNWNPQTDNQPATRTPANNGNDQVTCTETDAAGTTSDPTTYYMNIDQQTPMVAYAQPAGDSGGQNNGHAASAAMTPAALAAKTGLPQRDFGLAPLASKVAATANDPVPATGHLAPSGPAEFKLSPHAATTGVQYSDTATQLDATASELTDQSGVYGEYCTDTNQTESGAGGNVPWGYDDGSLMGSGGTTATLDIPQPSNTSDAVTGIHVVDCHGKDQSTFTGSDAQGAFAGSGAATTHYPYTSNQTQYDYTVNIDDVSPATIGWGIISQGETVTNPDPYAFDPGHWYTDEATLTATAQAVGNDLSDITGVVCAVNDPSFGQPNSSYTNPVTGHQVPYYDYTLDGAASEHPTDGNNDYTVEIPVADDNGSGTYYVSCFAVSGSGVNGTVSTTEVNLQNSAAGGGGGNCTQFCIGPVDPSLNVPPSGIGPIPGGQQWHTTDQKVPIVAQSPTGSAPIESITCAEPSATLDGDTSNPNAVDNGDGTITYPNPSGTNSNTESITVTVGPPPLGLAEPPLECYATDAAGVDHTLGSYQVNVDNTAPTGYFIRPNASDPRKVTLYATDNNGSGIGKVVLQLVNDHNRVTNLGLTSNTTGDGDYTAELPPDKQMARGSYALQAIVTDNAGNVTNPPLDQWQGGRSAVISYPLLGSAKMIDALGAGTTAPLLPGDKGTTSTRKLKTKKVRVKTHGKWVTKTVPVYKVTRVKRHGKLVKKSTPVYLTVKGTAKAQLASVKTPIKLAYRGKSTADGIVTTGAGVAVDGGKVQITQTVGGKTTVLGTATTNASGRWVYHVPAGPSRQLDFQYMGTPLIDAAAGTPGAELVTGGTITLKVAKTVKVGHKLVLKGLLPGGYIPTQGVALRVYYTEKGAHGTGDYPKTYHTNAKGRFTITEPTRKTARGHTYTFWVKAVTPSPWPYQGATSKKLTVRFK